MVGRIIDRIVAPVRGLHQAAYWLMILTLASQLLALLRDRVFAHMFGAGHTLDLYYAAFRVPDLVFALVSSIVSAYVLIPRITQASREQSGKLLSESISFLLLIGGGICLLLAIFARPLLFAIYPEFAASPQAEEFVLLTRLLLLQPILLGISGVVGSVTQVERRFVLFALSPVFYNLGIIFGTVVLYPEYGLVGIGAGVVLGALLHVAMNAPALKDAALGLRLRLPRLSTMLPVARDSIPRSLALGMGSLTALALTALAARLPSGAVSVFTLAGNLEAVPLALIGGSYAVAAFPALSESAGKDSQRFAQVLSSSARHIIIWSVVLMGLVVVLRAHIVRVILGSGAFGWGATRLTAALLAVLAVGLVAQGLVLLFSRALYAAKQSWRPLGYQFASFVVTVGVAYFLLTSFHTGSSVLAWIADALRVADVGGAEVLLLALAATFGQLFLAGALLVALARVSPGLAGATVRPLLEGLVAALIGALAAYGALYLGGGVAPLTSSVNVFTEGLIAGIVGLAASLLTLALAKNAEFEDLARAIARLPGMRELLPPSAEEPLQS